MINVEKLKRIVALGGVGVMLSSPIAATAEGLAELLQRRGIDVEDYKKEDLTLEEWEELYEKAFKEVAKYVPNQVYNLEGIGALVFLGAYNFTSESLIPELAAKQYIYENNCIDLGVIKPDDPNTDEIETKTEIVDIKGFSNWINAQNCYNDINAEMEHKQKDNWRKFKKLDTNDYLDPSVFIPDERQRGFVHEWFVNFIEGYDLTKGSFSKNEKLQLVYNAIAQLDGSKPTINSLDASAAYITRAFLANWFKIFIENYMYENYLQEFVSDRVHVYDPAFLVDNERFVKYEDARPIDEKCISELRECINVREALDYMTTVTLSDNLQNMLHQKIIPYEEYMKLKESVKNTQGSSRTLWALIDNKKDDVPTLLVRKI